MYASSYGATQRAQEFAREDQLRKLGVDTMLRDNLKSDERVETKRRLARMAEEQAEAQLAYRLEAVRVIVDSLSSLALVSICLRF